MLKRCPACRGKKQTMGAGMIFHTCKTCLGVGYVEEPTEEVINEKTEVPKEVLVSKRKKAK